MNKRFLSLILVLALAVISLIPAATADSGYGEENLPASPGYFYVHTDNGKTLNVRNSPGGGDIVGHLKNGSRIYVDAFTDENWALITFHYNMPGYGPGDYACWVNRRFLTRKKPDTSAKTATQQVAADPLEEINKEFKEAKVITPVKVIIRPSRVSGWVNMYWAPSVSSELQATYRANDELLAIRELPNWYQVEDQGTGAVGFINKQFLTE